MIKNKHIFKLNYIIYFHQPPRKGICGLPSIPIGVTWEVLYDAIFSHLAKIYLENSRTSSFVFGRPSTYTILTRSVHLIIIIYVIFLYVIIRAEIWIVEGSSISAARRSFRSGNIYWLINHVPSCKVTSEDEMVVEFEGEAHSSAAHVGVLFIDDNGELAYLFVGRLINETDQRFGCSKFTIGEPIFNFLHNNIFIFIISFATIVDE